MDRERYRHYFRSRTYSGDMEKRSPFCGPGRCNGTVQPYTKHSDEICRWPVFTGHLKVRRLRCGLWRLLGIFFFQVDDLCERQRRVVTSRGVDDCFPCERSWPMNARSSIACPYLNASLFLADMERRHPIIVHRCDEIMKLLVFWVRRSG